MKANNSEFSHREVLELLMDSLELASENTCANNAKGISVGFFKGEAHTEIQVMRLYK